MTLGYQAMRDLFDDLEVYRANVLETGVELRQVEREARRPDMEADELRRTLDRAKSNHYEALARWWQSMRDVIAVAVRNELGGS